MTNKITINDLTNEQLKAIIEWCANGNACWDGIEDMTDKDIRHECLCIIEAYCKDTPLNELLDLARVQFTDDAERLSARGIGSDVGDMIKSITAKEALKNPELLKAYAEQYAIQGDESEILEVVKTDAYVEENHA